MKSHPLLAAAVACTLPAIALAAPDSDRAGAPYFEVEAPRGQTEALPLASTRSDVRIAGTIAHVRVTQVYQNRGSSPLEATYVFPGSTRAAVFAMRMKIAERTIEAKIQTKEQARKTYEKAKAAGKSASLLEQKRPNVFRMKVANIMPSDTIEVQLDYVEMLIPDAGVYELVIPSVVGPRYTGEQGPNDPPKQEAWTQNPYVANSPNGSPYKWGVGVQIDAGLPIAGLSSPSHKISPRFSGPATAGMESLEMGGGDRDFVLRYKLTQDRIASGLLLFPGEANDPQSEKFFAMMMQPPRRPAANQIPPREYIFIVDVSGSMNGFPLDVSKTLMTKLLKGLKSRDRFNVLLFAGGNRVLADKSLRATPANIDRAIRAINRERGGGGTQLLPALRRAMAMPRSKAMSTSIVVVTDGYISVEKKAFDIVRKGLGEANMFAFGIGSSVNRHLVEGLARAGMGEPFVVLDRSAAPGIAERFRKYIEAPVLTNIGVQFDGFDAYDVEPATMPDLFAERPILLFGKYKGKAKGRIVIEGRNGLGRFRRTMKVANATRDRELVALKYLWARHRIADLADYGRISRDASVKEEVTALGLKYSLMTEHTSFVAVDSLVRNQQGQSTSVVQPLPMPKGVRPAMAQGIRSYGTGRGGGGSAYGAASISRKRAIGRRAPRRAVPRTAAAAEASTADAAPAAPPPPPKADGRVQTGPLATDKHPLARPIRRLRRALAKCFDTHAKDLNRVEVRFSVSVSADGKILGLTWLKASGRPALDQCLAVVLKRMRLPKRSTAYTVEDELVLAR